MVLKNQFGIIEGISSSLDMGW